MTDLTDRLRTSISSDRVYQSTRYPVGWVNVEAVDRERWEAADEIERLRQFRDAVTNAMHERAGNDASPFAYIWQDEWVSIKKEFGA